MKVLVIIQPPTYGGPHNQVLRLSHELRAMGWTTEVILPTEEGTALRRMENAGIEVFQVPMTRMRKSARLEPHKKFILDFYPTIRDIRRVIDLRRPDVIQVCGLMNVQAGIAGSGAGVPIVWQILGTFAPPALRRILTPIMKWKAHRIMAAGLATARAHPGLEGDIGGKVTPFYPPVDAEEFQRSSVSRQRYRRQLGIGVNDVLVATVGNCNRSKAHDIFVSIAKRVREKTALAKFRIFGSCSEANREAYEKSVIDLARDASLYDNGFFDIIDPEVSIPEVLSAADIFLLTSMAEGAPTAVIEAMACSLPVVSTHVGAIDELVINGETGFIRPRNVDELSDAVMSLIEAPDLRNRFGEAGRREMLAKFSAHECARLHVQIFNEAINDFKKTKDVSQ